MIFPSVPPPRDFKFTLRDVNSLWLDPGELRGEVDLKQLVLITFAKHVAPKSVEYLRARLAEERPASIHRYHYAWSIVDNFCRFNESESFNQDGDVRESKRIYRDLNYRDRVVARYLMLAVNERYNDGRKSNLQSIFCVGRRNYMLSVESRNAEIIDSTDVDVSSLREEERLPDQDYFKAIEAIFTALKNNDKLLPSDVDKLILAGSLSPLLYERMRGEVGGCALPRSAWLRLFRAILSNAVKTEFSDNEYNHPAAAHTVKIANWFWNAGKKTASRALADKALCTSASLSASMLLYRRTDRDGSMVLKAFEERDPLVKWNYIRYVIIELGVIGEESIELPGKILWIFYYHLQDDAFGCKRDGHPLARIADLIQEDEDRPFKSLKADVEAFEVFMLSMKNFDKFIKESNILDRVISNPYANDAVIGYSQRRAWVEGLVSNLAALKLRLKLP